MSIMFVVWVSRVRYSTEFGGKKPLFKKEVERRSQVHLHLEVLSCVTRPRVEYFSFLSLSFFSASWKGRCIVLRAGAWPVPAEGSHLIRFEEGLGVVFPQT